MNVRLTNHMKYRLLERGIFVADIKVVLKNPDYNEPTFGNKYKAGKFFDGKTLETIYLKSKSDIVIVTAYFL